MGANDEPSNPFKNPRRTPANPKTKTSRQGKRPQKSGPPAPPGAQRNQSPPVAPSGSKKANAPSSTKQASSPAKAGKSVGLRKQDGTEKTEAQKKTDERARELIEASRVKVMEANTQRTETQPAKKEPSNPFKKNQASRPAPQQRRGGRFNKRNKPQGPSKRVQKLHRGKYMEFKYDVRKILEEENVEEEHRSNVLGQTWAKGERQGVSEAKNFLEEKVAANIISEECSKRIIKLIDSLTTRR